MNALANPAGIMEVEIDPPYSKVKAIIARQAAIWTALLEKSEIDVSDTEFHLEMSLSIVLKKADFTQDDIAHLQW